MMFMKVLLAIGAFLINLVLSTENGREARFELGRTLDLIFCLAIIGFIATKLGAFEIEPITQSGYDAFVPLMIGLAWLGIKAVLFVVVPAALLCRFLRNFEGFTPRLVIYGLFATVAVITWYFSRQQAVADTAAAASEAAAEMAGQRRLQREEEELEQARADAERQAQEDHERDLQRLVDLTLESRQRWRDDVRAARAFGLEGEKPPMLTIIDHGAYEKRVTNLGKGKVCVQLARVIRQQRADEYLRCESDLSRPCVEIPPGVDARFNIVPNSSNAACLRGQLEYRVGTPLEPEPTWWSVSALADFDQRSPDPRDLHEQYSRMTPVDLDREIARVENMLLEIDRAVRWRRELGR